MVNGFQPQQFIIVLIDNRYEIETRIPFLCLILNQFFIKPFVNNLVFVVFEKVAHFLGSG